MPVTSKNCIECDTKFSYKFYSKEHPLKHFQQFQKRKFCSRKCSRIFYLKNTSVEEKINHSNNVSIAIKKKWANGEYKNSKLLLGGWKHSLATKEKMSLKRKGAGTWNWKGGRDIDNNKLRRSSEHTEWSKNVRSRDNWECKINNKDCCGRLEAHHILSWKDFPELRYEVTNGIALCNFHHPRSRSKELEMSPYFQNLIAESK